MTKVFIVNFINLLTNIYIGLIFIRVIFSWFPKKAPRFQRFIYDATEPILGPIRKTIPPLGGAFDLSPIVAYLLLYLIQILVERFLI